MFEIEDSTTASVENFFFQDLLPATTLDDTFLEQVVRPTGLLAIDPAAHLLNSNVNQAVLDHRPGRGRGARKKRKKRDPYVSIFFLKYLKEADEAAVLDDQAGTIHDAASVEGLTFHQRFGIPYSVFEVIHTDWLNHGEYRCARDAIGRRRTDSRILLLGCFRVLAKGVTFDAIEELSNVSIAHNHSFFKKFVSWFYGFYCKKWIHFIPKLRKLFMYW